AVAAAHRAWKGWSGLGLSERSQYLQTFTEKIKQRSDELAELIHYETGKPLWESKTEVATVIGKIPLSLDAYQQRTGFSETPQPQGRASLNHRPLGVMAVLGPYNFPAHLPNGHIV